MTKQSCIPQIKARDIRDIFTRIAPRYDLINQIISLGNAKKWRNEAVYLLNVTAGDKVLDIGTGTGDIAITIRKKHPEAYVVGVDKTPEMIITGKNRNKKHPIDWILADALALPFRDDCFNKTISAYLLRNTNNVAECLAEQNRVLIESGRIVSLETNRSSNHFISPLVRLYQTMVVPIIGFILAKDFPAYFHLSKSTANFQNPQELHQIFLDQNFSNIDFVIKMFGSITIFSGDKTKDSKPT